MRTKLGSGMLLCATLLAGADIYGTITIERKLTRQSVTAPAGMYERGVAVELGADAEADPLAFERSHVAVYIEGAPLSASIEPAKASIEQRDRRFVPDLVVVPVGSTVSFPNFDPIFHNVFSLSPAKSFDLGNYSKGQTRAVTFVDPGIVAVYCHLHSNMTATILVAPNRWATQADRKGAFVLKNIPAGTYVVVAWHKAVGTFRNTVIMNGANDAETDFTLPYVMPEGAKRAARR